MKKELIQKLFSKSCWDEQAEIDIEDFISVERFAELIIREYGNEIWNRVMAESADSDEKYLIRGIVQSALYDVKEHFGVEE